MPLSCCLAETLWTVGAFDPVVFWARVLGRFNGSPKFLALETPLGVKMLIVVIV